MIRRLAAAPLSRRGLLRAAGVGFVLPFYVPSFARAAPVKLEPLPPANAFLRIGTDDTVSVVLAHSEMGQGTPRPR